ncbi:MAG: glucokinase [Burkholderiales bacterium]|nr:glucokinase [Burkholderiales bacterium]
MSRFDSPRLIADIGGTFARFVVETAPGRFEHAASLLCEDHAEFFDAVAAYLASLPRLSVAHAAVAIANPVDGDEVRMVNYHWHFSIEEMRQRLGFDTLVVVNDFTALAMAVPRLKPHELRQVGSGAPRDGSVTGVIGAGSGLGVSGLIPANDGWVALGAEGGHASVAPHDERELTVLRYAWRQFPHVSFERLLSGPGLELIYRALSEAAGDDGNALAAPEITRRGLANSDALCRETIDLFCSVLGTAAGNLAVTLGAMGGIYVGGGIVPRLGAYFDQSPFRRRFENKGRFSDYLRVIPTYVITSTDATFVGASAILDAQLQLRSLEAGPRTALLERVRRALADLSRAEGRVANYVLAHPREALNKPIADIAAAAEVSEPTVIRFCRSLGCDGLSDFKLRLASDLSGTLPLAHAQVTNTDSTVELGSKVLGNTASALLRLREQLNREPITRAIELLNAAPRVEFYAVGHYGVVALDAQFKFLRFGIPCAAYTDARLQLLAAAALRPNDVVVIISSSGRVTELLEVADRARSRGAMLVAITASHSPLARQADVVLVVDHVEDVDTQLPMISRIMHLSMVDILAVGVAMSRSVVPVAEAQADRLPMDDLPVVIPENASNAAPGRRKPRRVSPGVRAATPLTDLTSHSTRPPILKQT